MISNESACSSAEVKNLKFGLLPDGYLVFSGKDSWRHLFFNVFYISFIAQNCLCSFCERTVMAIQLPKLRVAVRPHHVRIPVSRSLAVTTSHPPRVGRRSKNAMMIFVFSVFSIYSKIERKSPVSLSFLDPKGCCFCSSAWEDNSGAEWEWFHREFSHVRKKCLEISGSQSFRIFQCLKTLEEGQGRPEVWDSLCKSTAETSESPELANAPGIWADGEYAAFRWSPVYLAFKFNLFKTRQNIKAAPSR